MGSNPVRVIMSHNNEKIFWFICMMFCYALLAYLGMEYIIYRSSGVQIWHMIGIVFLCFVTTSAFKSMYYYEKYRNKN